jgi:hypothetical protein
MTTKVSLIADNAVTGSGISNLTITADDIADNQITSAKLQSGATDEVRAVGTNHIKNSAITAEKLASGAAFPVGGIIMWSGTTAPIGWQLCDGSNLPSTSPLRPGFTNTPDLRDKFILGATVGGDGTYPGVGVNLTGGAADAIIPYHNHGYTEPNGGLGHRHGYEDSTATLSDNRYGDEGERLMSGNADNSRNTSFSTTGITIHHAGTEGNRTNANLPPYYTLAFIMRVL